MIKSMVSLKYLAMILLVLSFVILVGCQPAATPEPAERPTEEPAEEPIEEPVVEPVEEPTPVPIPTVNVPEITIPSYDCGPVYTARSFRGNMHESGLFVDGQIILVGDPDEIAGVVSDFSEIFPPESEPISIGDIKYQVVLPNQSNVIELYALNADYSVEEAVIEVNARQETVFAEPNYILSNPLTGFGRGGGSGIVGDPNDFPSSLSENASIAQGKFLFSNQWAFWEQASISHSNQDASIGLYDRFGNRFPEIAVDSDVEVVIFDTVPDSFVEKENNYINWAVFPFYLCVWKPGMIEIEQSDSNEIDLQDHGLFATGLAQGVAPVAQYHLIEVLNADAIGDLFTLLRAMDLYTKQRWNSDNELPMANTVINLSLGLEIEKRIMAYENYDDFELKDLVDQLRIKAKELGYVPDEQMVETYPVVSLYLAIENYHAHGAVVVAASGNDESNVIQTPAAFPEVIGVGAINVERNRSCFSNLGNLAASGGDGCSAQDLSACDENGGASACDPLVLVSLIYTDTSISESNPALYAYWNGTSFSAPLVSGLAALVFDATSELSSQEIQDIIYCSTDSGGAVAPSDNNPLGAGVINVQKAFSDCLNPSNE